MPTPQPVLSVALRKDDAVNDVDHAVRGDNVGHGDIGVVDHNL